MTDKKEKKNLGYKESDFLKEWPAIKKQLVTFSQEAGSLVKKGEKEIVRLSKKGKLHLDSTTLAMQKEKLFYQIGKEYVKNNCPSEPTASLKKLIEQLKSIDKKRKTVQLKIKKK